MKIDPTTTFLNRELASEPKVTRRQGLSPAVRWRLMWAGILTALVAYLTVVGIAVWEQVRPTVVQLPDGWWSVRDRLHHFEIEVPMKAHRREYSETVHYSGNGPALSVMITCEPYARFLLNKTESKLLQDIMATDGQQGTLFELGSGVASDGTHWAEYEIRMGEIGTRRRLMIKKKKLFSVWVSGPRVDLKADVAERIMNSARMAQ